MKHSAIFGLVLSLWSHCDGSTAVLSAPFITEWANTGNATGSNNCGPASVLMIASAYANSNPVGTQLTGMDEWLQSNCSVAIGCYATYSLNNGNGSGTNTQELAALATSGLSSGGIGLPNLPAAKPFSNNTLTDGLAMLQQELSQETQL